MTIEDEALAHPVVTLLSEPRLRPYLAQTAGSAEDALALYAWSTRMAAAAFETVSHLEVLVRNALDRELTRQYREQACGIPWFLLSSPAARGISGAVDAVRQRLQAQHRDTRDQIIAGLSFGTWSGMLGPKHEDLWRECLRRAFPGSSGSRKQVMIELEGIRKFRNKIAHHDSMLNIDTPFETRRVIQVARFVDDDAASWLAGLDRSGEVYSQRPSNLVDTVVVAARNAWPLYEDHHAYVCQPNRAFRPVDRIAFYADQEIKQEVPRIVHRRDNVPWTRQHAASLAASGDPTDKKVAAVIMASRATLWTEGVYQVFLLTRPGHPQHRTLAHPVQRPPDRGAFTQGQRYVSLHALENASTTADLSVGA